MNGTPIISIVKSILVGLLLITFQNILAVYVHAWISLPDIITITIFLYLFHSDQYVKKWFFITAFAVGLIQSAWSADMLGIVSMYYLFLALFHAIYNNVVGNNLQLLICVVLAMIFKGILFTFIAFVLNIRELLAFVYSMDYVYQGVATLVVTCTIGFIINTVMLTIIKH